MKRPTNLPGMIGTHPAMRAVYALVWKAAPGDLPVVIFGETGTGKELVAQALHTLSARQNGPFVDVNCAAVPESLAESELFGWERGAFTGAVDKGIGRLEEADGGTLFLDEACKLSLGMQGRLLRAIESKQFRRVGGRGKVKSDFRLVLALGRPLDELMERGEMRHDFAYRVMGVTVELPPLRRRRSDISGLATAFLRACCKNGHSPKTLSEDALAVLRENEWPGNVRELKALMERLHLLVEADEIKPTDIGAHLPRPKASLDAPDRLAALIEENDGDVGRTAAALGVSRATVYRRLQEHAGDHTERR